MLLGPPLLGRPASAAPAVAGRPVPPGLKVPSWWREDAGRLNIAAAREAMRGRR